MTSKVKGLRIYGFGGHARSIADVAIASGIEQLVFADLNAHDDESFLGFPVIKTFDDSPPDGWQCFAAAGDNRKRWAQSCIFRRRMAARHHYLSDRYGGQWRDDRSGDLRWPSLLRGAYGQDWASLHSEYRLRCRT